MESTLYFEQAVQPARGIALTELLELFLRYNPKLAKTSKYEVKQAFDILLGLFPDDQPKPDTGNFKVGYLLKLQNRLIELDYAQSQINRLFGLVKRVFTWAGQPRFDLDTYDKLPAIISSSFIADMQFFKPVTDGKENLPREDVEEQVVSAVFPYLPQIMVDMLKMLLLTGMRPGELCKMKNGDLKKTKKEFAQYSKLFDGVNWIYVLPEHKTKKFIGVKAIPLGLEEQEILGKYISDDPQTRVFKRANGKPITVAAMGRKLKSVIEKKNLEKFTLYQIRHTALTLVSLDCGKDTARAVAGHTTEKMTDRYDHSDLKKVLRVVNNRNNTYRKTMDIPKIQPFKNIPKLQIFTGE
jgi:integrase